MKGIDRTYISRGFGRKGWSIDTMIDRWKKIVADKHPELLDKPEGIFKTN